jgi:3-methyladenine DNA glycosylase AlkD
MQTDIIAIIRRDLAQQVDEKTRDTAQNYFKEEVLFYGVKTHLVHNIALKHFREIKHLGKQEIFSLCAELLKSDYGEEAFIAFDWAYVLRDRYEPSDFIVFESWLKKYVNNWAKCDTLCNHTIGTFVEKYPQYIENLKEWAKSENRWLRRAAAVTLIIPARKGLFLDDIIQIADILLTDKDNLVQKGYSWMLKAASQSHQREVFDYVMQHRGDMPRTALRYSIEKMPANLKLQAMSKG